MNLYSFQLKLWWQALTVKKAKRAVMAYRANQTIGLTTGRRKELQELGTEYRYDNELVIVPYGYPEYYFMQRRFILCEYGKVMARAFDKMTLKEIDDSFISSWCKGHGQVELADSFVDKQQISWKWILLIVALVAIGFIVYKFVLSPGEPGPVSVPEIETAMRLF